MPAHRISAGALVEHEERLLLVRHHKPGAYDFWVAPGGGVEGDESLEAAAEREVREETGLAVTVERLAYVEDMASPDCRYVKFWFLARWIGGALDVSHPEAVREHVVEADWHALDRLPAGPVFPAFLRERFQQDRAAGFGHIVRLPLRRLDFW